MENNSNKWKGNDVSLSECIENYGMVYTYDGNDFNGWIADGVDKDGNITTFAPFWMDNNSIDDYFDKEGDEILIRRSFLHHMYADTVSTAHLLEHYYD